MVGISRRMYFQGEVWWGVPVIIIFEPEVWWGGSGSLGFGPEVWSFVPAA